MAKSMVDGGEANCFETVILANFDFGNGSKRPLAGADFWGGEWMGWGNLGDFLAVSGHVAVLNPAHGGFHHARKTAEKCGIVSKVAHNRLK